MVLLSGPGDRTAPIQLIRYQVADEKITKFIQENYAFFCFVFHPKKYWADNRYIPKIDKVIYFFIIEKKQIKKNCKTGFLFALIKKNDFDEVK
jgi:hypothetical protein